MLLATPEQKVVVTYFVSAGRFCNFLCDKKLREKDLQKEYTTKALRVKTAVEYKGRPTLPLRFNPLQLRCCPPKTWGQ